MISFGFDRDKLHAGPFLDPLHPQCPYAEELMALITTMTLNDPVYLARLERHYALIKEKFAGPDPASRMQLGDDSPKERAEQRRRERRKRRRDP
jgi:hypothetical protein